MYNTITDHLTAEMKKNLISEDSSEQIVEFTRTSMVYTDKNGKRQPRKRMK
jgi:hypothetical protein